MKEKSIRIIIADDDEEIRKVLSLILEKSGYSVTCAVNGEEALKLMDDQPPDLLLLDIMMPRIDGLEVIRRMREIERIKSVPVIAFTALTSQLIEKELFDLGVRGFMRKPLHISDLVETVDMELDRLAAERAHS